MSYTSGRTVKSPTVKVSTPRTATAAARRLITNLYPGVTGITVDSRLDYDMASRTSRVRTVITYPETLDSSDLACTISRLRGYIKSDWTTVNLTVYCAA